jgi:hypothetical protein
MAEDFDDHSSGGVGGSISVEADVFVLGFKCFVLGLELI